MNTGSLPHLGAILFPEATRIAIRENASSIDRMKQIEDSFKVDKNLHNFLDWSQSHADLINKNKDLKEISWIAKKVEISDPTKHNALSRGVLRAAHETRHAIAKIFEPFQKKNSTNVSDEVELLYIGLNSTEDCISHLKANAHFRHTMQVFDPVKPVFDKLDATQKSKLIELAEHPKFQDGLSKMSVVPNNFKISDTSVAKRKPQGLSVWPYPVGMIFRYIANVLSNGKWSYINPDHDKMHLLSKKGSVPIAAPSAPEAATDAGAKAPPPSSVKVVFLGDIMVSKDGKPPVLDESVKKLLASADIIVANIEAPVVEAGDDTKRGLSLSFKMSSTYLEGIHECNPKAQWVFSLANNHACDNSAKSKEDVSGVKATVKELKRAFPDSQIIGADIGEAQPVLSLQVKDGPKLGIVGWTDVMNNDGKHNKKKIMRGTDLEGDRVTEIKKEHNVLIGFPHGNIEQSYHPLKDTRDNWMGMMGEDKFDVIVGQGPHVLHPAEQVGDSGLLFNSIGNFCSPLGKSQTKVGCIPEINIEYNGGTISSMKYEVHLSQQKERNVSLFEKKSEALYPDITDRIEKNWGNILS